MKQRRSRWTAGAKGAATVGADKEAPARSTPDKINGCMFPPEVDATQIAGFAEAGPAKFS